MVPVFFVSKSVFTVLAQKTDPDKKIVRKMNFPNSHTKEPMEILEVRSNGKVIQLDKEFTDDVWLQDFTIKFKNVSGKTITFIYMVLVFPETAQASEPIGIPTSHPVIYGLFPSRQATGAIGMKLLENNKVDEITLSAKSFDTLKTLLGKRRDMSLLSTAELHTVSVDFEDGMRWSAGDLFRPDPASPGKYTVVKENE